MAEPHQRTQSGKLRAVSKRSINDSQGSSNQKIQPASVGIVNAEDIKVYSTDDDDDILKFFAQTPTCLSNLHVDILTKIARECGIDRTDSVDRNWRNTWNIGTWCIGNQVSASINIVQPNIAECWIGVASNRNDDLQEIISKYSGYALEKSTCSASPCGSGYQIKGRWGLHAVSELRSLGIIKKEPIEMAGTNICQSRVFIWLLVGKNSEYLCTLTQQSIVILARHIPDYVLDIEEPTEAKNITLRIRNPEKVNDNSQLSINTAGWIQFNGRPDNVARLYGALSIALRNVMKSLYLKPFLGSLHYDILPEDF